MSGAPDDPIAYTALEPGTPMWTSDGQTFGTVQAVLADDMVSVFDGIVVHTHDGARFVDADQVASIYTSHVRTTLSREEAADLPVPAPSMLIDIKPPRSVADRLGRLFGRRRR